eukprot:TRINITY_DN11492_c0_g1_i2.p1 TRINITY_DN11492_c0_g1~~TRINITY_DN11492_c0_g1_i2.p1  ORF type:complete len:614 (-),score=99.93 TRINITY_DN11492_c0_g1_i2:72-1913(-)
MAEVSVQANAATFGAAVSSCSASSGGKDWKVALDFLWQMQDATVLASVVVYSMAITVCERAAQWVAAFSVLGSLRKAKVAVDTICCNAALSACEKAGQWEAALSLLGAMEVWKVAADAISVSAVVSACQKDGQWAAALDLLFARVRRGLSVDTILINAAISACERAGQWQVSLALLAAMPSFRSRADTISWNGVISSCGRASRWPVALSALSAIAASAVPATTTTYNSAASAVGQSSLWSSAAALVGSMAGQALQPDRISWTALLAACSDDRAPGAWRRPCFLLETMGQLRLRRSGLTYGAVISALQDAGQASEARGLLKDFRSEFPRAADLDPLDLQGSTLLVHKQDASRSPESVAIKILEQAPGVVAFLKPDGISTQEFLDAAELRLCCARDEKRERSANMPVHFTAVSRLDKPTSGTLVAAVGSPASLAANWLQAQFAGRLVGKEYICLSRSTVPLGFPGTVSEVKSRLSIDEFGDNDLRASIVGAHSSASQGMQLQGETAHTSYKVLSMWRRSDPSRADAPSLISLLSVRPHTGRTHQIRAHLSSLGGPLVSDRTYSADHFLSDFAWCPRLFLHCRRVSLLDLTLRDFVAKAPLPADLMGALQHLAQGD